MDFGGNVLGYLYEELFLDGINERKGGGFGFRLILMFGDEGDFRKYYSKKRWSGRLLKILKKDEITDLFEEGWWQFGILK